MMTETRQSTFHASKSYDVVFIGQLGAVIAHHLYKHTAFNYKCLVINNSKSIIQPSLSTIYSQRIKITKQAPEKCDLEIKQISRIRPLLRQIEMQNGVIYYYRYLIYGDNDWVDLDSIPKLRQALSNQYSLVYSNWIKTDLSKSYKYQTGNLVFYVPNGKHAGYENFNFLAVYSRFLKAGHGIHNSLRCKVILQGTCFFPSNKGGDEFVKQCLRQNSVEVIQNTNITNIDYLRRKLTLNNKSELQYNILYCILPQKVPTLLVNAEIDPYCNHPKTLLNKNHKNIFVFGADIFPTTHSFTAINHQAHIIRHNILNALLKKPEMAYYEGETQVKFWLNNTQSVKITHNYQQSSQVHSNCFSNYFSLLSFKTFSLWEKQIFYNLGSDGAPYYFVSPNFVDCKTTNAEHEQKTSIRGLKSNVAIALDVKREESK